MGHVLDFLAEKEIIILCGIIAVLSFVLMILFIQEAYMKAKKRSKLKQNTQELKNLTEEVALAKKTQKTSIKAKTSLMSNIKEIVPPKKEEPILDKVIQPVKVEQEIKKSPIVSVAKEKRILDNFSPIGPMPSPKTDQKEQTKRPEIIQAKPKIIKAAPQKETPNLILEDQEKTMPKIQLPQKPIQYKDEVYTKTEAQQELERLTKTLQQEEPEKIELTAFEARQEETAIISLEELLSRGKQLIQENEEIQYQDAGNEPISLQELERKIKTQALEKEKIPAKVSPVIEKEKQEKPLPTVLKNQVAEKPQVTMKDLQTSIQNSKVYHDRKYIPTPVISPVFGLEDTKSTYHDESLRLENTANFEKLDDEIRKTNEFLALLKELEKKLD